MPPFNTPSLTIESSLRNLFNSFRGITIGRLLRLLHNAFRNAARVREAREVRSLITKPCCIYYRSYNLIINRDSLN